MTVAASLLIFAIGWAAVAQSTPAARSDAQRQTPSVVEARAAQASTGASASPEARAESAPVSAGDSSGATTTTTDPNAPVVPASELNQPPQPVPVSPIAWQYRGLTVLQDTPAISSLLLLPDAQLAVGFQPSEGGQATTLVYRISDGTLLRTLRDAAPISLIDGRSQLCAVTLRGDQPQLVVRTESAGALPSLRLVPIPLPSSASAAFPYQLWPARFAPDGTLIMVGSGRDRLYRINLALGESRAILPEQPVDIIDFDVSSNNELVILDSVEQRVVWLDLEGKVLSTSPLARNDGLEPSYYYLSVAAGRERISWVGLAVRGADGSFIPEIQRVQDRLRQRQALGREQGMIGFPLQLRADGQGGVFAVDERNTILQLSSAVQPVRTWMPSPPVPGAPSSGGTSGSGGSEPPRFASSGATSSGLDTAAGRAPVRLYLTDSGLALPGLEALMQESLPALNRCYERLLQVSRGVGGKYRVQLTTRDRGIHRVEVQARDFDDLGLESCMSRAFSSARFSSRVGQQTFRLDLSFTPPAANKKP